MVTFTSGRRRRWVLPVVVVFLFSAASVVPGVGPVVAAGSVRFQQYSTCPKLLTALRSLTLPYVGPYGLSQGGGVLKRVPGPVGVPVPATASSPATTSPAAAAGVAATAAPAVTPAPVTPVSPTPVFTDASAAANSSATNVQELGVDEGDSVENDGRYLYATVARVVRVIDTADGKAVASLGAANGSEQLLLDGKRLAVARTLFDAKPETVVEVWDVSQPSVPHRLSETHLEGVAMAVRTVGHRARIVLNTPFAQRLVFATPINPSDPQQVTAAIQANRRIVQRAGVDAWLPRSYVVAADGTSTPVRTAIDCREVGKPTTPSGLGFTWVATIDLDIANARVGGRGSGGVIAQGQTVYASSGNLYVATMNWGQLQPAVVSPQGVTVAGPVRATPAVVTKPEVTVHQFDLTPRDGATYRASGVVPGTLLNQFSMSEFNGVLRVATTTQRTDFGTQTASGVHVLRRNGRSLDQIGVIDGLGSTEQIYAVRFVGDLGYVVTFRRTGPLFVLDLRDPTRPTLLGQLAIPGYSAYLQPIGPGRLLGIGQDATPEGRVTGLQLSLFDVSDPTTPRQLSVLKIGGFSGAEYDHHAFLFWPATGDVIVPVTTFNPSNNSNFQGVVVASVTDTAITERGRIKNTLTNGPQPVLATTVPGPVPTVVSPVGPPTTFRPPVTVPPSYDEPIVRSLIIDTKLTTVSANAVKSSELASLAERWFTRY